MILLCFFLNSLYLLSEEIIIDSKMSFDDAKAGIKAPKEVLDSLCLLDIVYISFDGKTHQGQLIVHKELKDEVKEIFELIYRINFPVGKAVPIVKYKWSDEASMEDNNTSSFNYRFVAGTTRLSNHALGRAVDINPFFNPVIYEDGKISPKGAKYNPGIPGTFDMHHPVVIEFIRRGWRWGGNFNSFKDYHHFDKSK